MERDFRDFKRELRKINHSNNLSGFVLTYDEAMEEVREYLTEKLSNNMLEDTKTHSNQDITVKDKAYLREKKAKYRELIIDCINEKSFRVKDYENDLLEVFIEDMVAEFAGYSILEDAFADPEISDIYILSWNNIYVEKKGINQKYHKTFKNPKHFENTLKRFVGEAGKEINLGDAKIVDFELFQDRCCATSPGVSPKSYSLTIRKHSEDKVTLDNLINQNVIDEKISELLGLLIVGETNIICGGITGSGKTTTIRALLDYYVTKANKRMLVCEDTQELFPKNDHTLELVSVKSDNKAIEVPLKTLIYTSLRLKPKYIVVGEVRGEEAEAMVEGMETGHSTITTMHGNEPINIIDRLVTKYLTSMPSLGIDVVERIVGSGVDFIFIQDNIPGVGRKVTSLSEVSYNFVSKRVEIKPIFRYSFREKTWIYENKIGKEKAEKMLRRGINLEELEPWIEEGVI